MSSTHAPKRRTSSPKPRSQHTSLGRNLWERLQPRQFPTQPADGAFLSVMSRSRLTGAPCGPLYFPRRTPRPPAMRCSRCSLQSTLLCSTRHPGRRPHYLHRGVGRLATMAVGPGAWDLFFRKLSAAKRAIPEKNDATLDGRVLFWIAGADHVPNGSPSADRALWQRRPAI